ncbi:hypothetical protein HanHA300_Chr02g0058221 [Helianthus annuus]|nr:hypothetical protein HanHA300_Chr02g0058221 [Helianthus annuus]KAJ0619027.1 hypothetical protein HanHA89_Chr02g0066701 [Helianthus annuus]KAJ0777480.1 hypothetical protein HanLR1_Chr02g0060961 [Helianthus annuus]
MVNQTSRFDAQYQNSRLDAHEQQIQQLKSDVTAIKDSVQALHDERSEFQKFVVKWMHHQDSRSNSRSTLHLPASSSDSSLQCVIAKLEEIISRSEERWYGKEHQFQVGHFDESGPPISDSAAIIYVEGTSPRTSTEFDSKANEKIIGTNHDEIGVLEINRSDEHLDEVIHSSKFELCDILKGSGSPPAYGVDMSNLGWAPTHTLISGSIRVATPVGNPQFGVFAPSPIPNNHPSQDRIGSKLLVVQTFGWKPGWDFGWLDYARPPVFASKLFVLDADPKPPDPYTNLKSDLLWKRFHGWCKTASQVAVGMVDSYHWWVLHGQGRLPEDATTTIST